MLGTALYYPHIDISDPAWLRSAVLFWNDIKTIAPRAVRNPYMNADTDVLWREGFLEPLRCDLHPDILDTLGKRVVGLMDRGFFRRDVVSRGLQHDPNASVLMHADKIGARIRDEFRHARIHPEKLSPEMRSLALRGGIAAVHAAKLSPNMLDMLDDIRSVSIHPEKLAPPVLDRLRGAGQHIDNDGEWLLVDSQFAEVYMSALAALLAKDADISALTDEEPSMGVNLHTILEDLSPSMNSDTRGALVSFVMESIKVDPGTRIDTLLAFRRSRENQLAELTAQFEDLSSKITNCNSGRELEVKAKDVYVKRIRPKLEALKSEMRDSSIHSVWEGVQRAVTVSVPAGGALAYFSGLSGTTLLAAGAAIAVTDVAVRAHLARNKARRASPFTYLMDVQSRFSASEYR